MWDIHPMEFVCSKKGCEVVFPERKWQRRLYFTLIYILCQRVWERCRPKRVSVFLIKNIKQLEVWKE